MCCCVWNTSRDKNKCSIRKRKRETQKKRNAEIGGQRKRDTRREGHTHKGRKEETSRKRDREIESQADGKTQKREHLRERQRHKRRKRGDRGDTKKRKDTRRE